MKRLGHAGLAFLLVLGRAAQGQAQEPAPPASPPVPSAEAQAAPLAQPVPAPAAAATASTPAAPTPAVSPGPAVNAQAVVVSPGHAVVHVGVNYRDAWLETRKYVDGGDFVRTCRAPCDTKLDVQGLEARVVAPGMTPSNTFRFDGGAGSAGVRVDGGSATARTVGIILLATGIPLALGSMALFAQGRLQDKQALEIAGIAGLSLGGVGIGVSLPLLLVGTTRVKSADGSRIATVFALSVRN